MIKFELINPRDPIYFFAEDNKTATLATVLVGEGKYSAESEEFKIPFFMFGGFEEFCKDKFGGEINLDGESQKRKLIDCLMTFEVNGEQTSLNNICQKAKNIAKQLEKKIGE